MWSVEQKIYRNRSIMTEIWTNDGHLGPFMANWGLQKTYHHQCQVAYRFWSTFEFIWNPVVSVPHKSFITLPGQPVPLVKGLYALWGGPNGPKICGQGTKIDFKDRGAPLGVSKKPQHSNFQDSPKNVGFTTFEKLTNVFTKSLALKLILHTFLLKGKVMKDLWGTDTTEFQMNSKADQNPCYLTFKFSRWSKKFWFH